MRKAILALAPILVLFSSCKQSNDSLSPATARNGDKTVSINFNRQDHTKYFHYNEDDKIVVEGSYLGCTGHKDFTEKWKIPDPDSTFGSSFVGMENLQNCKIAIEKVTFFGKDSVRELSFIDRDMLTSDVSFPAYPFNTFSIGKKYRTGFYSQQQMRNDSKHYKPLMSGESSELYHNIPKSSELIYGTDFFSEIYTISWNTKINQITKDIDISFYVNGNSDSTIIETVPVERDDEFNRKEPALTYTVRQNKNLQKMVYPISFRMTSPLAIKHVSKSSLGLYSLWVKGDFSLTLHPKYANATCKLMIDRSYLDSGNSSPQELKLVKISDTMYQGTFDDPFDRSGVHVMREMAGVSDIYDGTGMTAKPTHMTSLILLECNLPSGGNTIYRKFHLMFPFKDSDLYARRL